MEHGCNFYKCGVYGISLYNRNSDTQIDRACSPSGGGLSYDAKPSI